ncbi:MAG TPA: hypothetical protein VE173_06730, partial [Longimicrobiales bacterium]|nr:hypothetical protein [Longimicrobiales bacterium]
MRVVSRGRRHAVVELRTGGFEAVREAGGRVRVRIPGFEDPVDPHAAALPFKRVLLDGPVGRRARVSWVRAKGVKSYPGLVPTAVGHREMEVLPDGTVRAGRRGSRLRDPGRGAQPRRAARLEEAVFVGESKGVPLELFPVRFVGSGLRHTSRLRVRVEFVGREAGESGKGSRGRRNPRRRAGGGETLGFVHVGQRGLHGVSFETLFPGRVRSLSLESLSLRRQGEAVGFHVEPRTGRFGPGSVLYFWAERGAESTSFSGEVAYELLREPGGKRMSVLSGAPWGDLLTSGSVGSSRQETNRIYQSGLLEAEDLWQWENV